MLGWYATELSSAKAKVEVVSSELSNVKVQLQAVTTSLNSLNTFQQEREVKRDQTQERIFQELSDIKRSLDRR